MGEPVAIKGPEFSRRVSRHESSVATTYKGRLEWAAFACVVDVEVEVRS